MFKCAHHIHTIYLWNPNLYLLYNTRVWNGCTRFQTFVYLSCTLNISFHCICHWSQFSKHFIGFDSADHRCFAERIYSLYNCCPPPYRAHEYSALGPPPHMYPHIYPTPHNNVGPTCITTLQSPPQGYGFLFRPDTYFAFLFNLPILCHKQPTSKPILKPHPLILQRRKWRLAWYCMIFMHL